MTMDAEPDANQLRSEADRISRNDAKVAGAIGGIVPREETIEPQPVELYRSPTFLKKTASPELIAELDQILRTLWEINGLHVGQNTKEIEVFYSVTGEYRTLVERARAWCHSYFERRADPT